MSRFVQVDHQGTRLHVHQRPQKCFPWTKPPGDFLVNLVRDLKDRDERVFFLGELETGGKRGLRGRPTKAIEVSGQIPLFADEEEAVAREVDGRLGRKEKMAPLLRGGTTLCGRFLCRGWAQLRAGTTSVSLS